VEAFKQFTAPPANAKNATTIIKENNNSMTSSLQHFQVS
jgi:hypothetical protein